MTAKEYFKKTRKLDVAIETAVAQIAELEAAAEKVTRAAAAVRVRGGKADHEAAIMRLMAARQKCEKLIAEYAELKSEAVEIINRIPCEKQRKVLTLYYIAGKSWKECAKALHYSIRSTQRLHGEALYAVGKVM